MRVVVAFVVMGDKLTSVECENFIRTMHTKNTGLTVLGYNENSKENPWWVWTWNDHAHLG